MTAHFMTVTQFKQSERMALARTEQTLGQTVSEPTHVHPQNGSPPLSVSSNSCSAGHDAPSPDMDSKDVGRGACRQLDTEALACPQWFCLETNDLPQQGHWCRSAGLLR